MSFSNVTQGEWNLNEPSNININEQKIKNKSFIRNTQLSWYPWEFANFRANLVIIVQVKKIIIAIILIIIVLLLVRNSRISPERMFLTNIVERETKINCRK